jgi:predicted dehydrogenase
MHVVFLRNAAIQLLTFPVSIYCLFFSKIYLKKMPNKRREFLKLSSLTGAGILTSLFNPITSSATDVLRSAGLLGNQRFNMSGYAAPRLDKVRIGFIGLGNRGPAHVTQTSKIEGVEIKALCDLRPEKAEAAKKKIENTSNNPDIYTKEGDWKKLCERKDIDLIYIATPWYLHAPMSLYAMEHGKHVVMEVPAAITVEDSWKLVDTSERTRKHCMILENSCYDFFELLTLNMARHGFFGDIVHCEGAYIHALMQGNFAKTKYWDMWRLKQNATRNGNLYPTHGLGPVAQVMNINRGDRMDYMVSMSGNDFMMGAMAKDLATKDPFYKPYSNKAFRGNMNTTTIRTVKGRTIMLQHDVTSPRPYSRIHLVSGTKGTAQKYPLVGEDGRIAIASDTSDPELWNKTPLPEWISPEEYRSVTQKYIPPIVKKVGEMAKQVGGHGGMDFLMNWRLIDCLRNGLPFDIDVYDTASWGCIGPLSEVSVAKRATVEIPDFTRGSWQTNQPLDINLKNGGNTKVII